MALILTAFAVFIILIVSELWWRYKQPHSEFSRKFIHVTIGTFVAFWPFFLSWNQIRLLALGFVVAVVISKWLHVFQSIHSVQRPTWGEVYFALVVGLVTFVTHSKAVYAVSLAQMSLADGLAAVVGVAYGKKSRYYVLGHAKSVVGSLAFLAISVSILLTYALYMHLGFHWYFIAIPIAAMIIENVGVAGLDNLFVPLLVAVILTHM